MYSEVKKGSQREIWPNIIMCERTAGVTGPGPFHFNTTVQYCILGPHCSHFSEHNFLLSPQWQVSAMANQKKICKTGRYHKRCWNILLAILRLTVTSIPPNLDFSKTFKCVTLTPPVFHLSIPLDSRCALVTIVITPSLMARGEFNIYQLLMCMQYPLLNVGYQSAPMTWRSRHP